jgi:hypothetical protein
MFEMHITMKCTSQRCRRAVMLLGVLKRNMVHSRLICWHISIKISGHNYVKVCVNLGSLPSFDKVASTICIQKDIIISTTATEPSNPLKELVKIRNWKGVTEDRIKIHVIWYVTQCHSVTGFQNFKDLLYLHGQGSGNSSWTAWLCK